MKVGLSNRPNDPAVTSMESVVSWTELDDASSRLAANYLALGLKPGDRVASLMPNRTALIVHYIACFKAGLVLTPLNYRYMPPEIDHALAVSDAQIILAHAERADDIAASKASNLPLGVVWYGADEAKQPSIEELIKVEPQRLDLPTPDPKTPAAIFFTSGSTGPAKGVTHTREVSGLDVRQRRSGLRGYAERRGAAGIVLHPYRRFHLLHGGSLGRRTAHHRAGLRP